MEHGGLRSRMVSAWQSVYSVYTRLLRRRLSVNHSENNSQMKDEVVTLPDQISTSTKKKPSRDRWDSPVEFFLSCVGYSVGLGNLWRFPYLCMQNGGGAFLIPYFTSLFICGMPMFFLEMLIGQYTAGSCITVWNLAPIFKGIGWGMMLVSAICCIYYNIIMSWVYFYFVHSFSWELPWSRCGQSWNTENCFSYKDMLEAKMSSHEDGMQNISLLLMAKRANGTRLRSSVEEFWLFNTLNKTASIDEVGGIRWQLLLCFIASWIVVYLCLFKGIKSSGKIVYLTALAPYVFITIILIRGCLLEGSWRGIEFYIKPKWETLYSFEIWSTAATQIFYSLGPGWGGIITFGSYNDFRHNALRDGIVIPIICCLTSFYAGFAIFSVLGHMAHVVNTTDIRDVAQAGPGLAFVAYPEALSQLPGGAIWSVLFFAMLITLGLDSMFATLETSITGLIDQFPKRLRSRKTLFTLLFVIFELFLGLIFTTRAGVYYFQIVDWYMATLAVIVIGVMELIVLIYIYDIRTVLKNMDAMLGKLSLPHKLFWSLCWCILSPAFLVFVIISVFYGISEPKFDGNQRYPRWSIVMGWCISVLPLIPIPAYAIYVIVTGPSIRDWKTWFRPNEIYHANVLAQRSHSSLKKATFPNGDNGEAGGEGCDKLSSEMQEQGEHLTTADGRRDTNVTVTSQHGCLSTIRHWWQR